MPLLHEFHDLLMRVEATSSKTEKAGLIKAAIDQMPGLKKLFEAALSPYITYGIARLGPTPPCAPVVDQEWVEGLAMNLLDKLASREFTGNAARQAISEVLVRLAEPSRVAFERILLKDLRAGFSESTVNKACPGTVPVFSCQLAVSEMPKLHEIVYPVIAEPKLDGVRTIAIKRGGFVSLFSRNGLTFDNFGELKLALEDIMPHGTVYDGEIISPSGFAALMTRAKAKNGKADDVPIEYHVFDGMSLDHWVDQKCPYWLLQRHALLDVKPHHLVKRVASTICHTAADLETFYATCTAAGYEGVMIKDVNGLYTFKRNKTWRKLKPFDTVDLTVIDKIEGTGKYAGSLGALVCAGEHGGRKIQCEVGSGFTDLQRAALWLGTEDIEGHVIEVRYQEMTQAQGAETWSLRFPTYVRSRGENKL